MSTSIKKQRIRTGLTQEEAASKLGVHPTTLNKYEGGSRTPSGKVLSAMSKLFGVSMDSLLNEKETAQSSNANTQAEIEEMYRGKYETLLENYVEQNHLIIKLQQDLLSLTGGEAKKTQGLPKKKRN